MDIFKKIIYSFLSKEKQEELRLVNIANDYLQSQNFTLDHSFKSFKEYKPQHGTLMQTILSSLSKSVNYESHHKKPNKIHIKNLTDMFKYCDMYQTTNFKISVFGNICIGNKSNCLNLPQDVLDELIKHCYDAIDIQKNPMNITPHINIISKNNISENLNFNREQIMALARISTTNVVERYTDVTTLSQLIIHNNSEKLGLTNNDFLELTDIFRETIELTKDYLKKRGHHNHLDFLTNIENIKKSLSEKEEINQFCAETIIKMQSFSKRI